MSPTPEDVVQVTLYQAPSDIHDILMAKDEIIAKLMADLAQANADKEDLQAQITQEEEDNVILHNNIDDQDVEIVGLTSNDTRNRKQITDLLYDRRVCYNNIDDQAYEIGELKAEVSRQNRRLDDQERKIEELEAERNIYERVNDEDNASRSSDSSCTDYDLMDLTSDEEEEEEYIDQDNDISSTTGNNGSDNSSAAGIKSEGEAMDYN
ncbi:hypothetical protein FOPG_01151 [Fusarium oxysporum f. sp. conglutinans race 2 54008]|uniref:Uncharacterized protein n=4 Tax=Fusarium oxysporum TaxID=5507 RepID=A0A8H6GNG7_FUSOX|nr:hypothetical protein FOXB_04820 [Fusarium oxysporum f. sp. conglutinans Fo5176]EXA41218.1 hypothetical protein FOVG_09729 [Fusarium oxysporum f. sp. pisi HDV247]EXL88232.1 hypothetical protein FOPG_01151 [Fusarium oxysporum f. sp. conglutinans race 2 54008]KAF6520852.1 hypothetical protein HZS61_015110 [Fusarium oxysporum f. sp. conglutinans]KAI8408755.1 hypothetical protein FOFC_11703 [Fusarium oxysporum]